MTSVARIGWILALALVPASFAFTQNERLDYRNSVKLLKAQIVKLEKLDTQSCDAIYKGIIDDRAGGQVRVGIHFGYEDHDSFTFDAANARALADVLKLKCTSTNIEVCGFEEVARGERVRRLSKKVRGQEIVIEVHWSSITNDDSLNKIELYGQQERASELARQRFLRALRTDDIVFYAGHSRVGGGPGFYSQNFLQLALNAVFKLPLQPMLETLQQKPSRLKLLGLISCDSNRFYRAPVEQVAPRLNLLVTRADISAGAAEQSQLGALNSILTRKCPRAFQRSTIALDEPRTNAFQLIIRR